jgi:hypothetical protein
MAHSINRTISKKSNDSCFSETPLVSMRSSFKEIAREITNPSIKKSYAQVASSVAPQVAPSDAPEASPHSAGHSPIPHQKKKSCTHGLKLRPGEIDLIREKAKAHRMTVNAYLRAKALGDDYIDKPPAELRGVLLKLYAELAGQGNNLNQLARKVNMELATAEGTLGIVDRQREPVFRALERLEIALSGRRPPDDY